MSGERGRGQDCNERRVFRKKDRSRLTSCLGGICNDPHTVLQCQSALYLAKRE